MVTNGGITQALLHIDHSYTWVMLQVGCMGFCMGGSLTLSLAQSGKIDCGAPCYGLPSEGHGEVIFI